MYKQQVLIYGAGDAGRMILAELLGRPHEFSVVGFVDDDPHKVGTSIDTVPVIGTSADIIHIIQGRQINRFIIALPSAHTPVINDTARRVLKHFPSLSLQILPSVSRYFTSSLLTELEEGRYAEIINRDEVQCDYTRLAEWYKAKTVVVTGAGGSIGSQLCRMLLRLEITHLVCVGRGENSLYQLRQKISAMSVEIDVSYVVADIKSYESLAMIFRHYPGALLLHAAAHKHVPFMEHNIHEAVYNNVLGSVNVLDAARDAAFSSVVFISTDKAVNPTSIMGTTKRICERLVASYNSDTLVCTSVRFGNVLGSRGSVIPLFAAQIASGGPVTVTDPRIRRYFMTIPEAAMLVLNAALYTQGADICLLEMGEMYTIADIARRMIELSGCVPNEDIDIVFTGLRPGEKLYEELSYEYERLEKTDHPQIHRIAQPDIRFSPEALHTVSTLSGNLFSLSAQKVRTLLSELMLYTPGSL